MAIRAQYQAEPIPGYKLLDRIGGGGFGEVWKCEAPGGILKAIKFVFGTLQSATEESGAEQELKSLNRVKSVRHPYILSLERYDIIDGQLLIVMELADKNLWDRYKECQAEGKPGIPRDELLRYMDEAAEALDLMNIQYGLQHLDIKPQNIFLVHNHIKVADFGLVKDLEGMNTQVTGGVTPIYAAPETFDGVISRYCDQYNLAIVYQELLTGQRPFSGTNARQLLMQHLTGTPNLSMLPACDQPVILRALSKNPEERFPSCTDMIQALRLAGQYKQAPTELPRTTTIASVLTEPAGVGAVAEPVVEQEAVPERPEVKGDGVLFPSLVIGLGGMGLKVLQELRNNMIERCGPQALWPHVQLLYVETDPDAAAAATEADSEFRLSEEDVILARLNRPAHYLRPARNRSTLEAWLNLAMVCRLPRNQVTTEGLRVLGRLALADNYRALATRLRAGLEAITHPNALSTAERQPRLGLRSNHPRVYIVSNLGGGTGSGMVIDLAYILRTMIKEFGYSRPDIVGLLLLPSADPSARKSMALVNTFATLVELNHFAAPDVTYNAFFDDAAEPIRDQEPPFRRCTLVPLPEVSKDERSTTETLARASDYLCRELTSPLGRVADKNREELALSSGTVMPCQTFGSYRFFLPRRRLVSQTAQALVRKLVQTWVTQDWPGMAKMIRTRLTEQLAKLELQPESLIATLQGACKMCLGEDPERLFATVIHKHFKPGGEININAAMQALDELDKIVGQPSEDGSEVVTSPMVEGLDEAARKLLNNWQQQLAELIRNLADEPKFRLSGAEVAGQQLSAMLEEVVRNHEVLLEELTTKAEHAYQSTESLLANIRKGSWWPGRKARMAEELAEHLATYPKARYQTLVLESLLDIYQSLLKSLPRFLEEIDFCRQRLTDYLVVLDEQSVRHQGKSDLGPGRAFLPGNSNSIETAVETLLESVKAEGLLDLDQKIQTGIRRQFKSLMHWCLAAEEAFTELLPTLPEQAEHFAEALLGKANAAAYYLRERHSDTEIVADLVRALDEATPSLTGGARTAKTPELCCVVLPADPSGERLGKLAQVAAKSVDILSAPGATDVYFHREQLQVLLADLPQLGLLAEEAYKQMTAAGHFSPHTRTDIVDWLPPV